MEQRLQAKRGLWLLLSLLAAITAWVYMERVLVPWENYFHVEAGTLKANLGDLYSPWFGAQALLLQGKNPYRPEVTHEIQMAFYGHDVIQTYDSGAKIIDEQRFAYPVYLVFLLAPIVGMRFATAQSVVQVVLAVAVLSSVQLWLAFLQWRGSKVMAWTAALFVAASPQIMQGLRLRQLGLVVALLLALGTWLVSRNYLALGGAVFALSTFKPQMVALPLSWFLLWSIGDLPRRWRFLAGFSTTLVLLVEAGELILPGWHRDFLAGLAAYRKYGPFSSLLQLALGNSLGAGAAAILVVGLLAWGWSNRKHGADSPQFAFMLSVFFVVTSLAFPLMVPFNQVLLILPVLFLVRDWARLPWAARVIFAVCVSWPWIASLALLASPLNLKSLRPLPLLPSALVLFLPFLLPVLLAARRIPISASTADI
jgi:hypothetical protein